MLDTIAEAKESKDRYEEALRDIRLLRKQMKSSYDKMVDDLLKGNKVSLIDRLKQKWG